MRRRGSSWSPFLLSAHAFSTDIVDRNDDMNTSNTNNQDSKELDKGGDSTTLTHVDSHGNAKMVDVGDKALTKRVAIATGKIFLGKEVFELVSANKLAKGDVLTVSNVAGIMGAKKTSDLIPLCHPISLTKVDIAISLESTDYSAQVTCTAKCTGNTGVEMEALTGVTVTLLTM